MAIITLTTDLGLKDYYVGAVKGHIFSQVPHAQIVDISHQIEPFDIQSAAYILKNCYASFPKGSIHILGVATEHSSVTPHVCVSFAGHYFLGSDNGIFSLLFDGNPDMVVELYPALTPGISLFPTMSVFAQAACQLAIGRSLDLLGKAKSGINRMILLRPALNGNNLRGAIIHIDTYFNAISNITLSQVQEIDKERPFNIYFGKHEISLLSKQYSDVQEGELLALFNTAGQLEIAINKGKASQLLHLHIGDPISLVFKS